MTTQLSFTIIDDTVVVKVNGIEVLNVGNLRANPDAGKTDLNLVDGQNAIHVELSNGKWGGAQLVGTLTSNDKVIHNWNFINQRAGKEEVVFEETIYINYTNGVATVPRGKKAWVVLSEVDDRLEIDVNKGKEYHTHELLRHSAPDKTLELTTHVGLNEVEVELYNGPERAVLKGSLQVGDDLATTEKVAEWDYQDLRAAHDRVVFEDIYRFYID